jgi:hypothetical protein
VVKSGDGLFMFSLDFGEERSGEPTDEWIFGWMDCPSALEARCQNFFVPVFIPLLAPFAGVVIARVSNPKHSRG